MRMKHLWSRRRVISWASRGLFCGLLMVMFFSGAQVVQAQMTLIDEADDGVLVSGGITFDLRQYRFCRDPITCELPDRLSNIDLFLRRHKVGLYTPDARPLEPAAEVVRLNIVPQALGYLNLYQTTHVWRYRQEAVDRLQYLLHIGPDVYGRGVRSGMTGYAFLMGYRYTGNAAYKKAAQRIAEECLTQPLGDRWMNGGLMCGFHLAGMYRLTGDVRYQTEARKIVERTSVWQYPNGAWPHQPHPDGGNTSYTAWMVTELLLMHEDDPGYELGDLLLAKSINFLAQRVNTDGSLNYSDAAGDYYLDPGGLESRFWTGELANIALDLSAGGRRDAANKVLRTLFSYEMTGKNRGGYPDKYNLSNTTTIWETGSPSVVRTSMIFWYLSMIDQFDRPCRSGGTPTCTISSPSCSPLYSGMGQCPQGITGNRTCLAGTYTSCFELATTQLSEPLICQVDSYCENDRQWGACYYTCYRSGKQLCLNGVCAGICYAVQEGEVQCDSECYQDQSCPAGADALPPGLSVDDQKLRRQPSR